MEVTYTISERDYVRVSNLCSKLTPKVMGMFIIVVSALALAAFFQLSQGNVVSMSGLVGGLAFLVFFRLVINPIMGKRSYRKYKSIQNPITINLEDEGVRFTNADSNGIIKWENILKWRQNDSYILIYSMPRLYHVVPKTIEDSGFDLLSLIEKLRNNVGTER